MNIWSKLTVIFIVLISTFWTNSSAYYNQWFKKFSENSSNSIDFSCSQQCIIVIGEKQSNDIISINNIQGEGEIIVGVAGQNNQIIPLTQATVTRHTTLYKLALVSPPQLWEIPSWTQIVIVIIGDISAHNTHIELKEMNLIEKVRNWWKDFWKNESLMPYSINLRYGIIIWSTSIVTIWYQLFLLWSIYIVLSNMFRKKKEKILLYWWIIIVLILWIRNLFTWIDRTNTWLNRYTLTENKDKSFFDLWDYISFTEQIRKKLYLDQNFWKKTCKIKIYSQPWPFSAHRSTVYLKPCEITEDTEEADYIIYYHQSIYPEDTIKPQLLNFNGSLLLQNK